MTPELVVGNTFMCVSVLQAGPCFRILYNSPNGEHGILRFDEYFKIKSIFVRPFLTLFGSSLYSVILRFGPQEKRSEGLAVGGREVGKSPRTSRLAGAPFRRPAGGRTGEEGQKPFSPALVGAASRRKRPSSGFPAGVLEATQSHERMLVILTPAGCRTHVSGGEMGKGFGQPLGDF